MILIQRITPEEMKDYLEGVSGNYVGIGVSVHMDENFIECCRRVCQFSCKRSWHQENDKIIKVDDEDVTAIRKQI